MDVLEEPGEGATASWWARDRGTVEGPAPLVFVVVNFKSIVLSCCCRRCDVIIVVASTECRCLCFQNRRAAESGTES